MTLPDEDLLDFDIKRLGGLKRSPRSLLEEHGDAYRLQLMSARWIEHWAIGLEESENSPTTLEGQGQRYYEGMMEALREIAAHLRQGDFLPGGVLYEDTLARRLKQDNSE